MVLLVAAAVLGVVVVGAGGWLLLPTVRSSRAEFEPTAKDDGSVFEAQQSFTIGGGGT